MKIGILTLPLHLNYGGILQAWALQQILIKLGHEPEMIYRRWDVPKPSYALRLRRCLSFCKCLFNRVILGDKTFGLMNPFGRIYFPQNALECKNPFSDAKFVKYRIRKTIPLYSDDEMRHVVNRRKYDGFIVGSDQVWREEYSPNIFNFFLDFLQETDTRKRIAYAASFGKEHNYISDDKISECRRLLNRFDAVSVRENEGIDIMSRDFGYQQVEKVLDPTLLLTLYDYENIIRKADRCETRYIATYVLDKTRDKTDIVNTIAACKKLPIREMNIDFNPTGMSTVSQWLALIADADFVVTDSFHGCVFSIIFGKPFVALANSERGLNRFVSLLSELNLSDRLIFTSDDFTANTEYLLSIPDYKSVYMRLDNLRQNSLKFLTNALA